MAPFNKRQVGYIKALAGLGKHKSFVHARYDGQLTDGLALTATNSVIVTTGKACRYHMVQLHRNPLVVDQTSSVSNNPATWDVGDHMKCVVQSQLNLLDCSAVPEGDENKNDEDGNAMTDEIPGTTVGAIQPTTGRVGSEFFLDKTHIRMRFTMPDFQVTSGKQPHHEYRLIVFRNRKPQSSYRSSNIADPTTSMHGASFLNNSYDLFNGYVGRPCGIAGWRGRQDFDGHEDYSGMKSGAANAGYVNGTAGYTDKFAPGDITRTPDDLMTLPLNDADYVVKLDERFFLGPEHGKSHYERNISFDWNQRGDTFDPDLAQGLEPQFNPLWTILLIGTTNDTTDPNLNILYRGTSTIESA